MQQQGGGTHCQLQLVQLPTGRARVVAAAGTDGTLQLWDAKALLHSLDQRLEHSEHPCAPLAPLAPLASAPGLHQSGVNALAFSGVSSEGQTLRTLVATGGDDGFVCVSEVVCEASHASPEASEASAEASNSAVRISVLSRVQAHASQVTGLSWFSADSFFSTSVDQRLLTWRAARQRAETTGEERSPAHESRERQEAGEAKGSLRGTNGTPKDSSGEMLQLVSAEFIGVADPKGSLLLEEPRLLFVYGEGVQAYDITR